MSKDAFLFCLVVGAALLAFWVAVRFPERGPSKLSTAFLHVGVAMLVSAVLSPAMNFVAGGGVLLAVFAVALPAFTYMFLAGIWLTRAFLAAVPY
jgi:uncharacterized membrane protein